MGTTQVRGGDVFAESVDGKYFLSVFTTVRCVFRQKLYARVFQRITTNVGRVSRSRTDVISNNQTRIMCFNKDMAMADHQKQTLKTT